MILTKIDGGLGNQMFQYAYGAYLADRHHTAHALDIQSYTDGPQHGYLLDQLNISAEPATSEILSLRPSMYCPDTIRPRWLCGLRDRLTPSKLRRQKESPFGFHPRHLAAHENVYTVGYWQSERFFPGMRDKLTSQFALRNPLSTQSAEVAEHITEAPSITLHIRRGDYLSNPAAAQIYCQLQLEYYTSAVQSWASGQVRPEVFVFSNDITWCKQNIHLDWPTHFVDHTTAATALEDMEMMRRAKCNVIANSTFSWWAAWLNQRSDATYAPVHWFQPGTLNGQNILPQHWTRWQTPVSQQAA